jgi:uncharacterized protein YeaO (DUF488 family)
MLKQASVRQIRKGEVGRKDGFIAITMCFYPRGLRKELRDEYRSDLAPTKDLLKDFNKCQKELGHEEAFVKSHYEKRFTLTAEALSHLEELSKMSRKRDVYLVCQCEMGERCHREILLLLAKNKFHAKIAKVFKDYPVVMKKFKLSAGRRTGSSERRRDSQRPRDLV